MIVLDRTCLVCSVPFSVSKDRAKNRACAFCSRACFYIYQRGRPRPERRIARTPINCLECGESFQVCRGRGGARARRFCSARCANLFHGRQNREKRTYEPQLVAKGYWRLFDPSRRAYVLLHRSVMEQHLGRRLDASEEVHHLNGIKGDNRIENLIVLSRREHAIHHAKTFAEVRALRMENARLLQQLAVLQADAAATA